MVKVRLDAPDSARAGTPVDFRLVVTNDLPAPVDLYLRGREPTIDVEVARPNGDVVWRRLDGSLIPAVLQLYTLPSGGHLYVAATWDLQVGGKPVSAGEYVVNASLLGDDSPIRAPARRLAIVAS